MLRVSSSIVLYNTNIDESKRIINCLLDEVGIQRIFLIDNSKEINLIYTSYDERIEYIHNPSNPGFGASHNIAIEKSLKSNYQYHFIVNPDVYFTKGVAENMINFISQDESIGMLMPQILNEDQSIQNLPKLLPSFYSIVLRKLKRPKFIYKKFIDKYEFRNSKSDKVYNVPILSGCFTLLNMNAINEIGGYDDRFFMYFEDWDLSRRMHLKFKTLYYSKVFVYHGYESGANKSRKLFMIFIKSMIYYFNKWGWFFDRERKLLNNKALRQLKDE